MEGAQATGTWTNVVKQKPNGIHEQVLVMLDNGEIDIVGYDENGFYSTRRILDPSTIRLWTYFL